MLKNIALAVLVLFGTLNVANAQENDFEGTEERLTTDVAGSLYEPGPTFVRTMLDELRYYGEPDLGLNLTSLTSYGVGKVLFRDDFLTLRSEGDAGTWFAQYRIIGSIRNFLANPNYLTGLWYQVKTTAVPTILNKVGQTRVNTWLLPAVPLFVEDGFNPALGKTYEDWRTNGCQWYLQISPDQGYTPAMSEEECAQHTFVKNLAGGSATADAAFVNLAHWYGFLWRRHLEGNIGLVSAWQSILNDVATAAQSS
jgi:hypothetical protein